VNLFWGKARLPRQEDEKEKSMAEPMVVEVFSDYV
jgi:hypothetical protein